MDRRTLVRGLLAMLPLAMAASFDSRPGIAQTAGGDMSDRYTALLKRYVQEGADGITRVDYAAWRANAADRRALDAVIDALAAQRPSTMTREEAFATWANLYNAITLKVILDRYPVASIRDIRSEGVWLDPKAWIGPWVQPRVTVEGRRLSLDDIEHGIMRPTFRDPRVHYAVNCASIGCPNLMNRAWRAETLEADLDAAARAFINHPRGIAVLPDGSLRVSSIYRWFREDFGGSDEGVVAHARRYAEGALAMALARSPRIAEDAYDWSLNRAATPRS